MNKRQREKQYKKYLEGIEAEYTHCQECGNLLNLKWNEYHRTYGTCNVTCHLHLVGMSWSDFY